MRSNQEDKMQKRSPVLRKLGLDATTIFCHIETSDLREKEKLVLKLRLGPEHKDHGEIGTMLGCGRVRVQQIWARALEKIARSVKRSAERALPLRERDIVALRLSSRTYNALTYQGIVTIGDLLERGRDIYRMKSFGKVCFREVKEKLAKEGLPFEDL